MIEKSIIAVIAIMFVLSLVGTGMANKKSSHEDVFELIVNAVTVLESLGEEGLEAFNNPKGEFVKKDVFVFIIDSKEMKIVAHPKKKRIGADISRNMDKNPDVSKRKKHNLEMIEKSSSPMGGWVEYWWPKLGAEKASRKISFVYRVPNSNYIAVAGIYDDKVDIEDLNDKLK